MTETPTRIYVAHGNPTGDLRVFTLDPATGRLAPAGEVASGSPASFVAFHPTRRFLYTTQNRTDQLAAFALGADGVPQRLNEVPVPTSTGSGPAGPAYVKVDASGRFLLAANYRGHNHVVFALGKDGRIGALVQSLSAGQHAHSVTMSPDNGYAFVCYLGSDLIAQYGFDHASGRLAPNEPPAEKTAVGAGPRHLAFHPNGRLVYLINELDAHLYGYAYDPGAGTLTERQRLDSLPGYTGRRWASDVHVSPSGRFVYVSNRAHDSLGVFAVDPDSGQLAPVETVPSGGTTPRTFCLEATGRFLFVCHQDGGPLVTFAIDQETGRLTRAAEIETAPTAYFVGAL